VHLEPLALTPEDLADGESWAEVSVEGVALAGIDARGLGFSDARFVSTDLGGARLQNLFLVDCAFERCNLAVAVVRRGSMRRVSVTASRLTGLQWTGGELSESSLADCRADMASFESSKLEHVVFSDCDLRDADFRSTRMDAVRFERCDLSGADLGGARLERCSMRGCTLEGLRGVDRLRGVAMPWEDIVAAAGVFAGEIGVRVLED
jgi:uncharacterized protein YjbI with pentapeptide repeats